ncbi:uncharacterized protein SOCEGT47_005310 [Sorangium cellulosum]|uniref:Uncharacterized protein n=1 Tax=Sorangium cellulosum TaxID=56 RepID=A0A4P2PU09_SORCE|nr:uncharacterized protein SOCEGT47_005310 [Sorangium cellulosum]
MRAVSALVPANYDIDLPVNAHEPIAHMGVTGMSDGTCPWDGGRERGEARRSGARRTRRRQRVNHTGDGAHDNAG